MRELAGDAGLRLHPYTFRRDELPSYARSLEEWLEFFIVEAEIDVGEIIIQGTVVGNIKAKRSIEIHAPGRVKGDLHTPSLQIDKGVIFEGRSFMEGPLGGGGGKQGGGQQQQPKANVPMPVKG